MLYVLHLYGSWLCGTGDVNALRELSCHAAAFKDTDSRGWLPLHTAAAQPRRDVLQAVLQGQRSQPQAQTSVRH